MNPGNRIYGHRAILARYCGEPERPIWGFVQHGWTEGKGIAHVDRLSRWFPKFVWSETDLGAMTAAGVENATAIGAPFLYLSGAVSGDGAGTLVYPFHSYERGEVVGSHADYLEEIATREPGPVTICLYWREYEDDEIRAAYASSGYRVITHGHRDRDKDFLIRQHQEISRHSRVVANRIGSALIYAGWLGRDIELYGPVFGYRTADEGVEFAARQRAQWPFLHDGGMSGADARVWAGRELGAGSMRGRDEMIDLFGWSGVRRMLGSTVNAAIGVRRPIVRLVRRWRPID